MPFSLGRVWYSRFTDYEPRQMHNFIRLYNGVQLLGDMELVTKWLHTFSATSTFRGLSEGPRWRIRLV